MPLFWHFHFPCLCFNSLYFLKRKETVNAKGENVLTNGGKIVEFYTIHSIEPEC